MNGVRCSENAVRRPAFCSDFFVFLFDRIAKVSQTTRDGLYHHTFEASFYTTNAGDFRIGVSNSANCVAAPPGGKFPVSARLWIRDIGDITTLSKFAFDNLMEIFDRIANFEGRSEAFDDIDDEETTIFNESSQL